MLNFIYSSLQNKQMWVERTPGPWAHKYRDRSQSEGRLLPARHGPKRMGETNTGGWGGQDGRTDGQAPRGPRSRMRAREIQKRAARLPLKPWVTPAATAREQFFIFSPKFAYPPRLRGGVPLMGCLNAT